MQLCNYVCLPALLAAWLSACMHAFIHACVYVYIMCTYNVQMIFMRCLCWHKIAVTAMVRCIARNAATINGDEPRRRPSWSWSAQTAFDIWEPMMKLRRDKRQLIENSWQTQQTGGALLLVWRIWVAMNSVDDTGYSLVLRFSFPILKILCKVLKLHLSQSAAGVSARRLTSQLWPARPGFGYWSRQAICEHLTSAANQTKLSDQFGYAVGLHLRLGCSGCPHQMHMHTHTQRHDVCKQTIYISHVHTHTRPQDCPSALPSELAALQCQVLR